MANINRVVLVGNLTKDPELKSTSGGTSICKMRIAVNTRRKDETGQWVDKPNYFDVTVWGNQAESCAQYLSKGRPVGSTAPRVARVGRDRRVRQAPGRRDRRRERPVPGSRDSAGGGATAVRTRGRSGRERRLPGVAADDDIPF
jgi:single-strand DNA-binding protein